MFAFYITQTILRTHLIQFIFEYNYTAQTLNCAGLLIFQILYQTLLDLFLLNFNYWIALIHFIFDWFACKRIQLKIIMNQNF